MPSNPRTNELTAQQTGSNDCSLWQQQCSTGKTLATGTQEHKRKMQNNAQKKDTSGVIVM